MENNIVPHNHLIDKASRQKTNGHRSVIVWFTGFSGSGKSTLAGKVEELLYRKGIRTYILDGDNVRTGLNNNLGFTPDDRKENIRRIGEAAKLFLDAGVVILTAFISPYRSDRRLAKSLVEKNEFIEVYVKCPLEICEQRDVKGLYKKARAGLVKEFTGISAPYEEPENPDITVETNNLSIEAASDEIYRFILERIKI